MSIEVHVLKTIDRNISLKLKGKESKKKAVYHSEMWNRDDCSYEGPGFLMWELNK